MPYQREILPWQFTLPSRPPPQPQGMRPMSEPMMASTQMPQQQSNPLGMLGQMANMADAFDFNPIISETGAVPGLDEFAMQSAAREGLLPMGVGLAPGMGAMQAAAAAPVAEFGLGGGLMGLGGETAALGGAGAAGAGAAGAGAAGAGAGAGLLGAMGPVGWGILGVGALGSLLDWW